METKAKVRFALKKPNMMGQNVYSWQMNDFEATRRFLEAIKTAADSCNLPSQDLKMWSALIC